MCVHVRMHGSAAEYTVCFLGPRAKWTQIVQVRLGGRW